MRFLKHIASACVQSRHFRAAYTELDRLTDRELGELGLTRGDIVQVAFAEAERRTEAALTSPGWSARNSRGADAGGVAQRGEGFQV